MRKFIVTALAALALPLAIPAMAQQNGAKQNAPAQNQQQSRWNSQSSDQQLSRNEIRQVQQALDQKGFKVGRTDGKLGPRTKQALSGFQKSQNLQQSGQPDQQTLAALGINQSGTTGQGPANKSVPRGQGQSQPLQQPGAKSPNGK
ncbi:MAG TPA: peptidoglycan-binding domain-containing protein [Xanthobacteraceae bacterium]|nr:peptidoglycan-binding domain-containing protein [Xanthobacteraceae bacterium]